MPFNAQTIHEIDTLFEITAIGFLLATLIFPLLKGKAKRIQELKIDTDTSESEYAINEHGFLERIKSHDPQHD
ncbi:hypothetical protein [Mucilaginibacter glaciei]|uniref:Uncharacterized protein n=1 Tax=Mucilaginibacter glaciei TaxID=2772109 RepID=A0A926S1W2_9SPHI|nr:hypothetical protein [Mucilaginibacter glaciei]MBD1392574.1 hypothetical protein [Mucilaginibacter glaciei]